MVYILKVRWMSRSCTENFDDIVDTIFDKLDGLSNIAYVLWSAKLDSKRRAQDINRLYAHYLFLSASILWMTVVN